MYIVTKQGMVKPLIERFFEAYEKFGSTNAVFYNKERYDRMAKLNPYSCTVSEFDEALGHSGWTDNQCAECGNDFEELVHIGEEPDYEASYVRVCKGCLTKSLEMFK